MPGIPEEPAPAGAGLRQQGQVEADRGCQRVRLELTSSLGRLEVSEQG